MPNFNKRHLTTAADLAHVIPTTSSFTLFCNRRQTLKRLAHTGKLEDLLVPQASMWQRAVFYLFGYTAIAVGLFLLFGGLLNS